MADEYSILKEGDAEILLRGNDVFYNKAQVFSISTSNSLQAPLKLVHFYREAHAMFDSMLSALSALSLSLYIYIICMAVHFIYYDVVYRRESRVISPISAFISCAYSLDLVILLDSFRFYRWIL